MSVLSATEIRRRVTDDNLIEQFSERTKKEAMLSFGLSYAGYDLRLGTRFLRGKQHIVGGALDPVLVNTPHFWTEQEHTMPFTIAPQETILATTIEKVNMPLDLVGIILGKSTYARCGIHVNATPIEPGWRGHITLEITNQFSNPVILRPKQGIAQLQFFEVKGIVGDGYIGAYQDQPAQPVPATTGIESLYKG